jgi:hypothetical protein
MSNAAEFADWKQHPTTKKVFEALIQKEFSVMAELSSSAGIDPLFDRFRVGYINALRDLYQMDAEDIKND